MEHKTQNEHNHNNNQQGKEHQYQKEHQQDKEHHHDGEHNAQKHHNKEHNHEHNNYNASHEHNSHEHNEVDENRLIQERIRKINEIRQVNVNPYPYSFDQKDHASEINEKFSELKPEEKSKHKVYVAGRVIGLRRMGKATFAHLLDGTGKIQIYLREDDIGKKEYNFLKKVDMGDFLGLEGTIFKTKTGELTVYVNKYELLCKSIRPLPEKYHGLKDVEIRYRKRYVDLISNPEVKTTFEKRSAILKEIRNFMDERKFMEVETPILQPIYGGANARPFTTHHHELDMDMFLRISPELYLKRLIVGGFERVYDINKNFRNEGIDITHNPEFTIIEAYQAYADYNDMMELCEQMYETVAKKVFGTTKFHYKNHVIDVKAPWERISMKSALKKYAELDVENMSESELKKLVDKYEIEYLPSTFTKNKAIELLFEHLCEDKLIQPTFLIDHPAGSTPLCKVHRKNPEIPERFEGYIAGNEICNAYSELNDPIVQRKLLEQQAKARKKGDAEANPMDEDFIEAIEYGMPPTGGIGIGIDRMIMVLTGQECIRDVILFPTMKLLKEKEE